MAPLFSSVMRVFLGLVLGVISSTLLCSSLINLVSPVSYPPILWSSWNPMTTIEDENFFFFLDQVQASATTSSLARVSSSGALSGASLAGALSGASVSVAENRVAPSAAISWSTSSKSSFPKSTPEGCLTRYLLRSLNP